MKNKPSIAVIVGLLLLSILFIGVNVKKASKQEQIRKSMVNNVFAELTTISSNLKGLLNNIENETTSYEANQQTLITLSCDFTTLHTTLKWYANIFQMKDTFRSSYTGITDFEHLAFTLTAGTGEVNDFCYSGIQKDGAISQKEVEYLSTLKNHIDIIIQAMTSKENPLQEDQNLTTSQMDDILSAFFSTWSYHNENSPYYLLESN